MPALNVKNARSKSSPRDEFDHKNNSPPPSQAAESLVSARKSRLFGNAAGERTASINTLQKKQENTDSGLLRRSTKNLTKSNEDESSFENVEEKKQQGTAVTAEKPSILKKTNYKSQETEEFEKNKAIKSQESKLKEDATKNQAPKPDLTAKPEVLKKEEPDKVSEPEAKEDTLKEADEAKTNYLSKAQDETTQSENLTKSESTVDELALNSMLQPFKETLTSFGNDLKEINLIFKKLNQIFNRPCCSEEIIGLNIGGTLFQTRRTNLTTKISKYTGSTTDFYEPHLLQLLVTGARPANYDANGAIFIDKNSYFFSYLLDYLRNEADPNFGFELPRKEDILKGIINEAVYFNLTGLSKSAKSLFNSLLVKNFRSSILNDEEKKAMIELCNLTDRLELVYRASYHGFSAKEFHSKCDGISRTLTIVKSSKGNVFGGYTECAWSQNKSYGNDRNAYVFSLINKVGNHAKVFICNYYSCLFLNNNLYKRILKIINQS